MTLRAQNERRKTFVFCIDYIEKMDKSCIKSYSLCFSRPKSAKFELSVLLPFRIYIVLVPYQI